MYQYVNAMRFSPSCICIVQNRFSGADSRGAGTPGRANVRLGTVDQLGNVAAELPEDSIIFIVVDFDMLEEYISAFGHLKCCYFIQLPKRGRYLGVSRS